VGGLHRECVRVNGCTTYALSRRRNQSENLSENLVQVVDFRGSTLFVPKDHLVVRGLGCGSFLEADGPSFWKVHVDNFDGILVSILEFKLSGTELLGAFRVLSDRRVDWL
jgi:hypothetical protein